jgi:peptide/nickel transport system permease protein
MAQVILRRLMLLPLIMLLVTGILFFLILQLPVEQRATIYMSSMRPSVSPEDMQKIVDHVIERYGLNRPFPVQYYNWLRNLVAGNWGFSAVWKEPVLNGLLRRVPASVELALAAMVPAIGLAFVLGSVATRYSGRWPDHLVRGAAAAAWAFPPFILGLMLLNVMYAWLGWFPPGRLSMWAGRIVSAPGYHSITGMNTLDALLNGQWAVAFDALRHLALPALTLALAQWALFTRVMRSSLLEALNQDYIVTARAKGVAERRVVNLHARRNALIPLISTSGAAVASLISTMVVVETVFAIDGIGSAATEAMWNADVVTVVGFTLLTCIVTVLASLASDVLCAFANPRVRV